MKRLSYLSILLLTLFIASCTPDSSNDPITTVISNGNWKISQFLEDGSDHTSQFNGYTFTFNTNGTLTATNGSNTVNGSWQQGSDNSKEKLIISLGASDPWEEISEDWEVLSKSSTLMKLQHISGGDGSIDLLTFQKN